MNIINKTCFRRLAALLLFVAIAAAPLSVKADKSHSSYDKTTIPETDSVGIYGMTPIYGRDIEDGTYTVSVDCSSSFFRVTDCKLKVKGDKMSAVMTISSHSYLLVYMGMGEEAAAAPASDYIPFKDIKKQCTFTVPVEALNKAIPCAAYSKRRNKWYSRMILFEAASLPKDALKFDLPDYERIKKALHVLETKEMQDRQGQNDGKEEEASTETSAPANAVAATAYEPTEPMTLDMEDGEYSIELNMSGGSGRASISSPTLLLVKDGKAYAKLIWSSTYYDYMIVGGQRYENQTTDGGNSTFIIPIADMDAIIPVIADTTAMGDPVEINYSITFYENTIGNKGMIPQEAAKKVFIYAVIIMIVGAVLNHFVQKKRHNTVKRKRR
ncbi:MAG: hypothetical protein IJH71_04570 [Eubacterium sp.]|nr:hypothetical protein [Eubacterium sp.]